MSALTSINLGRKCVRGKNDGNDRLSSLPDALLHHVMSFLPMAEVVRTSILSARWRNLWASTPFIHIDRQELLNEIEWTEEDTEDMHESFVDHLLLLRDGTVSLDEARILISRDDRGKSSAWIRYAIKHNARLLHVYGAHRRVQLDGIAMCPSQYLKRIRLESVYLVHGFFTPLNYNFPMLEHLELERCVIACAKAEISSRSLKVLHMTHCFHIYSLLICATNLTHISIIDPWCNSDPVVTRDLASLVTASIALSGCHIHNSVEKIVDHRLLDGLSHATKLELHAPSPELAFERGLQTCLTLSNLTSLVLGDWCMAADLYPLFYILHRSPNLKELCFKLKMEQCRICKKAESASLPARNTLPVRGYPCIERIKIYCSKDDPRVGTLVQALLPIFIPDGKISIDDR
ncbi:F-box/LRR-repeat protein At3g58900-like [Lolium rigidum]|uniref:F-box/LRR-repeat protein At3g58900-like n=1 Tax=Lolium rigidum TaxID=89674 RepID=UPI001F5CAFE2|nr:F-box/LRR-repeat protein At3g58900-like [Lolium rigidum]